MKQFFTNKLDVKGSAPLDIMAGCKSCESSCRGSCEKTCGNGCKYECKTNCYYTCTGLAVNYPY